MGGYVFTIDQRHPQHWDIAKREAYWDITKRCAANVGDTLLFWQTGSGGHLLGLAEATSSAEPLDAVAQRPWDPEDAREYVYRVRFRLLSEQPAEPLRWSQVQEMIGSGAYASNGVIPFRAPDAEEQLRSHFGVKVIDLAWPQDFAELDFPADLDTRERAAREIAIRRGQRRFRMALVAAYGGRCAVTGSTVDAVLEAAHISPYRGEHSNDVRNGLLLRSDVHTLFDLNWLAILPDGTVRIHPELNDTAYARFANKPIRPPRTAEEAPAAKLLLEHNARCAWLSKV